MGIGEYFVPAGMTVVDLGAAPGGWTLVAAQAVRGDKYIPWQLPTHQLHGNDDVDYTGGDEQPSTFDSTNRRDSTAGSRQFGRVVSCDLLSMPPVISSRDTWKHDFSIMSESDRTQLCSPLLP
jgi:23S rRNA U2552 (ribose-2'-O)-methylase RlmE/FtsJ